MAHTITAGQMADFYTNYNWGQMNHQTAIYYQKRLRLIPNPVFPVPVVIKEKALRQ